VALTRGGKRRPGGFGLQEPLSGAEKRLADRIARMLREQRLTIDVDTLARTIGSLDPDGLQRFLNEITIVSAQVRLADTLGATYRAQSEAEFRRLILEAARPGASVVRTPGVRLPSGILIPASLAGGPVTTFAINPVQQVILDYIDPAAVQYAQTRGAALVRDIDAANRTAVRYVIRDSMAKGRPPLETARLLRDTVGLHTRWARAVDNFGQSTMSRLVRSGMSQGRAQEQTDELMKQYRDRLIRRRAEMIARTETQLAQNMGRQTSWNAAYSSGLLAGESEKEWLVAPSGSRRGAPCDICTELAGQRVQWNAAFPTGHTMPPAHPHCRCTAVLIPPSRGLSGLPSQDMDAWLEQLRLMDEAV